MKYKLKRRDSLRGRKKGQKNQYNIRYSMMLFVFGKLILQSGANDLLLLQYAFWSLFRIKEEI